jgi:hypothetical protein
MGPADGEPAARTVEIIAPSRAFNEPIGTQAGRLAVHPLSMGNRHLITATKGRIDLSHGKNPLIAIGSSDYDVFAIKIVLNGRVHLDTYQIQQVPEQHAAEFALGG